MCHPGLAIWQKRLLLLPYCFYKMIDWATTAWIVMGYATLLTCDVISVLTPTSRPLLPTGSASLQPILWVMRYVMSKLWRTKMPHFICDGITCQTWKNTWVETWKCMSWNLIFGPRPVETEETGGAPTPQIFAKVYLLTIEDDSKKKKVAKMNHFKFLETYW